MTPEETLELCQHYFDKGYSEGRVAERQKIADELNGYGGTFLSFVHEPRPLKELNAAYLAWTRSARKALKQAGVETLLNLLECSEADLLALPGFGKKSLAEVKESLEHMKLSLRTE